MSRASDFVSILDDLDEQELRGLVEAVRVAILPKENESLSDAEILMGFIMSNKMIYVIVGDIASHCLVRKVLVRIVECWGWMISRIPERLRDRDLYLVAVRTWPPAIHSVPEPLKASIREELGI